MTELRAGHRILLLWLLPALLILLTILIAGSSFEASDDVTISFLFRGIIADKPVHDLLNFFYGIGYVISALYRLVPTLPWFGLVLYFLLYVVTVQAAHFLLLSSNFRESNLLKAVVPIAVLFLGAWLDHIMWFSFVRVAILLGGVSVLLFALLNNSDSRGFWWKALCICCFIIALCLRPKAALLGFGLAVPAIWWLVSKEIDITNLAKIAAPFAVIAVVFQGLLVATTTDYEREMRFINKQKSDVNDYGLYAAAPKNEADSIAFEAVENWLLGDRKIITKELFARSGEVNYRNSLSEVIRGKIVQLSQTLARDYFFVFLLHILLVAGLISKDSTLPYKRLFVLWQVLFWALLLVMGVWLKLVPRVATAAVSVHILALTGLWLKHYSGYLLRQKWVMLLMAIFGLLQVYKIGHRSFLQRQTQQQNEHFLADLKSNSNNKTVVMARIGAFSTSLSPFCNYNFGDNKVLNLTGWPTLLPYFPEYLQELTGEKDFAKAIQKLATNEEVIWMLPGNLPVFLTEYFRVHHHLALTFSRIPDTPVSIEAKNFHFYRVSATGLPSE